MATTSRKLITAAQEAIAGKRRGSERPVAGGVADEDSPAHDCGQKAFSSPGILTGSLVDGVRRFIGLGGYQFFVRSCRFCDPRVYCP